MTFETTARYRRRCVVCFDSPFFFAGPGRCGKGAAPRHRGE
jgi:hypothetical protein